MQILFRVAAAIRGSLRSAIATVDLETAQSPANRRMVTVFGGMQNWTVQLFRFV